ncbi:hypothetical protein BGZ60DRAFT_52571 [Tricladium varicosporioides]|nr:hypothetical protein BGZ60DRAFT_52571 [Hymenoscyphus varicosporioides]
MAAPAVAGLVAYYLSLPRESLGVRIKAPDELGPDLHIKGKVAQAVKDYIVESSYSRSEQIDQLYPLEMYNVAYNGAADRLCRAVRGSTLWRRDLEDLKKQYNDFGLSPVVVRGEIVPSASYPMPACSLTTTSPITPSVSSLASSLSTSSQLPSDASSISSFGSFSRVSITTSTSSITPSLSLTTPSGINSTPVPAISSGADPRCGGLIKCSTSAAPTTFDSKYCGGSITCYSSTETLKPSTPMPSNSADPRCGGPIKCSTSAAPTTFDSKYCGGSLTCFQSTETQKPTTAVLTTINSVDGGCKGLLNCLTSGLPPISKTSGPSPITTASSESKTTIEPPPPKTELPTPTAIVAPPPTIVSEPPRPTATIPPPSSSPPPQKTFSSTCWI